MYDGSDYGYGYDEPEQDQWPLSSQPAPAPALRKQPSGQFQRPHPAGARTGPPPRPQRPDYVPDNFEPPRQPARAASANNLYQQQSTQQRQPRSASAGQQQQQYQQPYQHPQSHHGNGQWTGNGYSNASPSNSSHGHPIVQQASYNKNTPPRPPLGPPPSARRGPSSYYSQQLSPVHPIAEEAERMSLHRESTRGSANPASQSRTSLASSNAIPIGIPKFYLDGRESGISITPSSLYSEADHSPPRRSEILQPLKQRMPKQEHEQGRNALPSQRDREAAQQQSGEAFGYFPPVKPSAASMQRNESPSDAPIRQASLSKRSKPILTHVKSGERGRKSSTASIIGGYEESRQKQPERDAVSGAPKESPVEPVMPTHTSDPNHASSTFFDSSSDSAKSPRPSAQLDSPRPSIRAVNSREHLGVTKPVAQLQPSPRSVGSPLAQNTKDGKFDALSKETLSDPKKRGLPRQDSDTLRAPNAGFSDQRGDRRRPPRLNVDAARDEEARGSLTSLSDLIKRATRLASNLDRGKTASRLGMEGWLGPGNGNNSNSELEKYYRNRSAGSLSDILASFPPPAVPTPTSNSLQNWSSRRESAPLPSECGSDSKNRNKRQRRCCGIPLWLFITLCLLLLVLVAAAVVIPMFLVVIPNMHKDSTTSPASKQADVAGTQASTLSKCATKLTCENGGQAFPSSDSAGEETCRCLCVDSFTGPTCTSKSTAGCTTMAIPDMEDNATVGSAIPRLITLASTDYNLNLDASTLLGLFNEADLSCAAENALVTFDGKTQKKRADEEPTSTLGVQRAEATSNGIVYDSTPSPSESASPTASSSSSSTAADVDVDFARAAILYVLQTSSSLDETEGVQKALQEGLSGGGVVESGKWKLDLEGKTVTGGT
jgi:hypothetical protein